MDQDVGFLEVGVVAAVVVGVAKSSVLIGDHLIMREVMMVVQ